MPKNRGKKPKGLTLAMMTVHEEGCMQMVARSSSTFEEAVKSLLMRAALHKGAVHSYDVVAFKGHHSIIAKDASEGAEQGVPS